MVSNEKVASMARKYNPLTTPWWVALVQGILALLLGLYLWLATDAAVQSLGLLLALYLYTVGLFDVAEGLRGTRNTMPEKIAFYRGVVAALVGFIILVSLFLGFLSRGSGLLLLGIGMVVYGGAGLYLTFTREKSGDGRIISLVGSLLLLAMGISALFFQDAGYMGTWVAWTIIALGAGLIALAFYRRSKQNEPGASSDSVAVAAPVQVAAPAPTPAVTVPVPSAPVTSAPAAASSKEPSVKP